MPLNVDIKIIIYFFSFIKILHTVDCVVRSTIGHEVPYKVNNANNAINNHLLVMH